MAEQPSGNPGAQVNPALEEADSSHLVSHEDYLAAVEAVLMVAEEPVTPAELATAVSLPQHQVQALLDELRAEADGVAENWPGDAPAGAPRQRGYELREVAGGLSLIHI